MNTPRKPKSQSPRLHLELGWNGVMNTHGKPNPQSPPSYLREFGRWLYLWDSGVGVEVDVDVSCWETVLRSYYYMNKDTECYGLGAVDAPIKNEEKYEEI